MSVWTHIEGTITVPRTCRFGIRDLMELYFDGLMGKPQIDYVADYGDRRVFSVKLGIDLEGMPAANLVSEFVTGCRAHDMGVSLEMTLRF